MHFTRLQLEKLRLQVIGFELWGDQGVRNLEATRLHNCCVPRNFPEGTFHELPPLTAQVFVSRQQHTSISTPTHGRGDRGTIMKD